MEVCDNIVEDGDGYGDEVWGIGGEGIGRFRDVSVVDIEPLPEVRLVVRIELLCELELGICCRELEAFPVSITIKGVGDSVAVAIMTVTTVSVFWTFTAATGTVPRLAKMLWCRSRPELFPFRGRPKELGKLATRLTSKAKNLPLFIVKFKVSRF